MKELRASKGGALRVLFMFDPRRSVILGWVATRPATGTPGTSGRSRLPTTSMTSTWLNFETKDELMARTKFSKLSDEVRARPGASDRLAKARTETLGEIQLYELRHREAVSQATLAGRLEVTQGAVSKLEHSDDVRVSTLRQYLEALGARLELVAVFDDEDQRVPIHLGKDTAA